MVTDIRIIKRRKYRIESARKYEEKKLEAEEEKERKLKELKVLINKKLVFYEAGR